MAFGLATLVSNIEQAARTSNVAAARVAARAIGEGTEREWA
jgi:hypothetical protein